MYLENMSQNFNQQHLLTTQTKLNCCTHDLWEISIKMSIKENINNLEDNCGQMPSFNQNNSVIALDDSCELSVKLMEF